MRCQCGRWTGDPCEWDGPREQMVVVEWMPIYLRASHVAAGGRGEWPHNGAERIRVSHACAATMVEYDPEWVEVLGDRP